MQIPKTTQAHYVEERDGKILLVSYKTIVAVFIPGKGWIAEDCFYSMTTSRHVNKFAPGATRVSREEFVKLLG